MFADPMRAQGAIDRLTGNAYDLVTEGESYRQRLKPRLQPRNRHVRVPPLRRGPNREYPTCRAGQFREDYQQVSSPTVPGLGGP
jgi:hypothetical protein